MIKFEPGEEIIFEIRKHWIILSGKLSIVVLAAVAPLIAFALTISVLNVTLSGFDGLLFVYFYSLWLFICWIVGFLVWTDYYLDVWVLTNRRLLDIEQKGIFNRKVSSLRLDAIQDITVNIKGLLPTILGYGHVVVQTAAEHREFVIQNIAEPVRIQVDLTHAHQNFKNNLI